MPGHLLGHLDLGTRRWRCPDCGTRHDRDLNAAKNILAGDGLGFGDPRPGDVIAPGYQHIDVLTASAVQNDGEPEPISANLAAFAAR